MSALPLTSQLESFLSLTNKRETVIATNMANIDTPGYRTRDVDFEQTMTQLLSQSNPSAPAQGHIQDVRGLLERPDGNNVDLDRESTLLAETQLNYQMGTQLLKTRFHQLLSAINSGASGD